MWGMFMIKKINILLVLLLLVLSISAVSAADDANSTVMSSNEATDIVASDESVLLSSDAGDNELLTSAVHVVNSSNYRNYFTSKGVFIDSSINKGDILKFDGKFSGSKDGLEFKFGSPVNIVGSSTNDMKECIFTFTEGASGSTISNLKIANVNDYHYGIFLNGANDCTIQGCFINNTGQSSYTICVANNAQNNNVSNNVLSAYGITYGHGTRSTPPLLLSGAHYNYIGGNQIYCDDANGIYLSSYEGGPLKGGESTFNIIYNNIIKYNVLPTSWAYGIQVMGGNNTISSNRVIGGYRGISTTNAGNVIEGNWIINLTGADYNHPGEETGGEIAIVGSYNSTIRNNHIVNAKVISTGSGISALDHSVVENNYVQVLLQGKGVYPQGSNITVKNNTIITNSGSGILYNTYSYNLKVLNNNISCNSGIGVLVQKVSNKRMPGNITIVGNTIGTSNTYAIDAAEANASSVNVIGPNNIKKGCKVRTPEGSYDPSKPVYVFNGTVHNINPSNYGQFINDNGGLSSDIKDGDILNFTGKFVNKNVIYINSAIKITGDNPVFYNTTFRVKCDGVWIENLVIRNAKADRVNAWGVVVYKVAGATVTNCDIDVVDPNAAYAIYVVESSDVDVIGNALSSSGDYLTYTLLAYATEDCRFINNTINTLGTGVVHVFEPQHCIDGDTNCLDGDTNCLDGDTNCLDGDSNSVAGSLIGNGNHVLSEVYRTYGILMAYSSGTNVTGNKVTATSKLNKKVSQYNSTNSIVGIDSYYNCQNNLFADNEVYIKAYDNYIYGMGVLGYNTGHDPPEGQGAIDNQFINNYIVIDGTYCAEGIIIGHASTDTLIKDNIIDLKSDNVAYGITLEMSDKSSILNNDLTVNSDVIYGIEAFSSDGNEITNNDFELNAKQIYGILFSNSNKNSVISNTIFANGTGEKIDFKNFDSIPGGNTGVFLKSNSTNNEIKKNTITSKKGYAILVDGLAINNVITENCLDSEKGIGNAAVNNTKNNVVENNYRYTFTGKLSPMKVDYLESAIIKLSIDDGASVKFYIDKDEIGSATSSNGEATLNYKFDDPYAPGNYKIRAIASKENYLTKEFTNTLKVNKATPNVVLNDVSAKKLSKGTFIATVRDASGNVVSGLNVKFYRIQGRYLYIGEATSDENGVAKLVAEIPSLSEDKYIISANVTGDSKFNAASGQATLYILKDNSLEIELNDINVDYNDGKNLVATLKDNKGNVVGGINVIVQLNGANSTLTSDKDGKVIISLTGLVPDTYTANVVFLGNDFYSSSSASAIVTVNKVATELTASDVTTVYNGGKKLVATLKDAGGNVIGGAQVKIVLGDVTEILTTDANGQVSLTTDGLVPNIYAATIAFAGDSFYKKSDASAKVTVNKMNSILTAKYDGVSKNIVATVKDANGNAVCGIKVGFDIAGGKYVVSDANGQAKYSTGNLDDKAYSVDVRAYGNELYKDSNKETVTFDLSKISTVLTAGDVTTVYNGGKKLVATLKDVDGNVIGGAQVKIVLSDVSETLTTDANGQVSLTTDGLLPNNYTATITYAGNNIYDKSSANAKVTVNKLDTILAAKYDNATENIVATVKDAKGNAVSGIKVGFDIDGVKYVVTDAKGQAKYSTSKLTDKTYVITVMAYSNDIYKNSNKETVTVSPSKISTVLTAGDVTTVYNGGKKLVATLKDVDGKAIKNAKVIVKLGDMTKTLTTDANGQVSLSLDGIIPNTYVATFAFEGDDIYAASGASAKVTVTKEQSKIFLRNALYFVLQTKMVKVTLWDANNKPLAGKTVHITLNEYGLTYTGVTDENGTATIRVGVGFGVHSATVTFDGDENYTATSKTGSVRVIKETPSLMLPGAYTKFKASDKTKTVKIFLKDRYNKPLLPGTKVFIKVNGKTYSGLIDINGIATINLNINKAGTYNAELIYAGNTAYNAVKRSTKISII